MELITYSLRTVAEAIIKPTYLLMLIVFGVIFYLKNKRTSMIQQMTIGEVIDTPLELTLSQLVIGILAGTIGSIILSILGVSFGNNSGIEFIFITSILLLIIRPRLVCFAYSGAVLGAVLGTAVPLLAADAAGDAEELSPFAAALISFCIF